MITLRLLIFFTLSKIAYSGEAEEEKILPLIPFKEVSKSVPIEGQYIFISKNRFFFEGKVLTQKQVIHSVSIRKPSIIKGGENFISLYCIKGSSIKDYMRAQKKLSDQGFVVCLHSHAVDLNDLYKSLAKPIKSANKSQQSNH